MLIFLGKEEIGGNTQGLPFHSPGDSLNPGTKPRSPALQVASLPAEPPEKPTGNPEMILNV